MFVGRIKLCEMIEICVCVVSFDLHFSPAGVCATGDDGKGYILPTSTVSGFRCREGVKRVGATALFTVVIYLCTRGGDGALLTLNEPHGTVTPRSTARYFGEESSAIIDVITSLKRK